MNIQNKLYTIQIFSPPNDQFSASPRAAIAEHWNHKFCRLLPKNFNSLAKEDLNSQKQEEKKDSSPQASPRS